MAKWNTTLQSALELLSGKNKNRGTICEYSKLLLS